MASASSPSSKRIKRDPSLSLSDDDEPKGAGDEPEQEHCTICLQSFLDRTIIPVCAHEFCFECILLWSEQSRKCPLCSRSFDDAYLIHHVRSQYDYQRHYLLPRSSPPQPPLAGDSRSSALRNTRRARQWGRRQRQEREEADQLERAIARRRWIYQHHLYAKHVASNPYTRYRPFPTPAQFAASPDLISRMTIFLRRELQVWPNLDVEFLTTYTISLTKSIDIRSEAAVRLLSEFLDLDTPYSAGARHVNAEHFAHEVYSYLRSPYRDLNTYDRTAQYDIPPEIPPPQVIERGNRWSADPSPSRRSRSRSNSRHQSLLLHRENRPRRSPVPRHGRDSPTESPRERGPNYEYGPSRSPHGREDHGLHHQSSSRRHSPPNGDQVILRNAHLDRPNALNFTIYAEKQMNNFPTRPAPGGDETDGQETEDTTAPTDSIKSDAPPGDDPAVVLAASEAYPINEPLQGGGDAADYADDVGHGSSANPQSSSRKRSAGLNRHHHTLSESVQAYLLRPPARWRSPKKHPVSEPTKTMDADISPKLLLRLTDGPTGPGLGR